MGLLSTLAAHDLGYISTAVLLRRLDATLASLEGLERYRGHFLNWYDTATLAPLHPRYVSTVDSGNLAGSLIALAQGLLEIEERPQTREQRLAGLADTADVLAAASSSAGGEPDRGNLTEVNRLARALVSAARHRADDVVPAIQALGVQLAGAAAELANRGAGRVRDRDPYRCRAVLRASSD